MDTGQTVRYSESFKLQVVREVESGRWSSMSVVRRAYGISGRGTVERWLKQYGKSHLLRRVVRVETPAERDMLKEQAAEIRRLKEVLANETAEKYLLKGFLQVACGQLGVTEDEFKKKADTKRSEPRRR